MIPKLAIVPSTLPDPPYPADTKTRGWRLETDYERLEQGDTWALAGPEIRPWLLMLYFVAWKQVPSGSLPASDDLIAAKIGLDLRHFKAYRDILMRGFWLANDGRFYHSVLTEQVIGMLQCRKNGADRIKKHRANNQRDSDNVTRYSHVTTPLVTTPEPEPEPEPYKPEPKSLKSKPLTPKSKPLASAENSAAQELAKATWETYRSAFASRWGADPVRNARVNSQVKQVVAALGVDAPAVAAFFVAHNERWYVAKRHPVGCLLKDAEGLHVQWATGVRATALEAKSAESVDSVYEQVRRVSAQLEESKI